MIYVALAWRSLARWPRAPAVAGLYAGIAAGCCAGGISVGRHVGICGWVLLPQQGAEYRGARDVAANGHRYNARSWWYCISGNALLPAVGFLISLVVMVFQNLLGRKQESSHDQPF